MKPVRNPLVSQPYRTQLEANGDPRPGVTADAINRAYLALSGSVFLPCAK